MPVRTNFLPISLLSVVLGIGIVNCSSTTDEAAGAGADSGAGSGGASYSGSGNPTPAGGAGATGNTVAGSAGTPSAGAGSGGGGAANAGSGGTASGGAGASGAASGGAGAGGKAGTGGGAGMGGRSSGGGAGTGGHGGNSGNGGGGGNNVGGAGAGGAPAACGMTTPRTGGTQYCANSIGNVANGYSYQLWSNGTGSGCMTTYGTDAAFKANWNNSTDFLARVGRGWNETQTFDQLGTISSDYAYTKTGSGGGFSFIGIYGWSNNPLVEFYIVEDWFGSGSPPTGNGTKKGSFSVDGGTYNVYQHTQTNQPSIHGNATFSQFFSVRQTPRQCGHISITEHFKEWASLGLTLGKMEEAKMLVEVGGGVGSIDFSTASITVK